MGSAGRIRCIGRVCLASMTRPQGGPAAGGRACVAPPLPVAKEHAISQTEQTVIPNGSTSFSDLGKEMWEYLTGQGAAINYQFVDMLVEVPRHTGADAPRATWRLHGTLRITTEEHASR